MDRDKKQELKKMARNTGTKVTESILRWKYKKEGRQAPEDPELQRQSRVITDQAHKIISERGKKIWKEFKKAVQKKENKGD
jgi:hypothetical protein